MATPGEMFLPAGDDPFGDIPIVAAQQAADVDPFADIPITATPAPELNPLLFNTAVATRQVGESLARVPGTIARMTDVPAITRGPPTPLSGLSVVARALQPLTEPVARFFAGETERLRQQFPGSVGEQGRDVERANAAFGAAFQGDFGPLREVITDPRAMGGYIGNALPSFAAAAMTGGSKSMIAALETAEIAKNAEEFTKKTGIEIGPEEFTKAVGVVGTINTAMERLGLGKVIQGQVGKSVVGKFFRTLLAGGFEGATESAQETTTNVATRAFIDPSQEPLEGVGAAALGGFGTGAAVSGARQLGPREAAPRSSPDDVAAALRSLGQFDDVTAAPLPAATAQSAQSAESAELPAGGRVVPVQRGGFGEAMEPAFEAVIPSGKGQTSIGVFPTREEAEQALRKKPAEKVPSQTSQDVVPQIEQIAEALAPIQQSGMGLARADLPQIRAGKQPAFLKSLEDAGVKVERGELPAGELKPIQGELNPEKVRAFLIKKRKGETVGSIKGGTPLIVSNDNFILDGHHRFAATALDNAQEQMPVLRVDLPIAELIDRARSFEGATFETVESTGQRAPGSEVITDAETVRSDERPIRERGAELTGGETQGRADLQQPAPEQPGDAALRQREQRPALAPEQTLDGDEREVFTPDGRRSVRARFEVSEAPAVVASHNIQGIRNEAFPAELQPRDRERAASQVQIRSIVNSLRPELLGDARTSDAGAPLTFDGNVVSGNARTIALQSAYQQGKAGAYKDFLIKNAEKFGISAEVIRNMRAPILHRRVLGEDFDAAEFARLSNESSAARMSPAEQARVDARRLSAEDLQSFRPDESGNVLAATNQRFVQRFLASVGQNEAANLVNSRGEPNIKAAQRIQAAVFELAYGDQQLLELAAEEANPDVRNILGGLNQAAAAFARARAQNAELAEQVTRPIINAIERIRQSRQQGLSIEAVLGQRDIETGEASEDVQNVARFLDKNIRSAKRIGTALQAIAEITHDEAQGNKSGRLFGGEVAAEDIIDAGLERVSTSSEQSDLFAPKRGPVEITATLDETGEEVRVEVPAEVALRRAEKRLAMLKILKRCVKR